MRSYFHRALCLGKAKAAGKRMKKQIALLCVLAMLASLAACSSAASGEGSTAAPSEPAGEASTADPAGETGASGETQPAAPVDGASTKGFRLFAFFRLPSFYRKQKPCNTISGSTMSSNAVIAAVKDAVDCELFVKLIKKSLTICLQGTGLLNPVPLLQRESLQLLYMCF